MDFVHLQEIRALAVADTLYQRYVAEESSDRANAIFIKTYTFDQEAVPRTIEADTVPEKQSIVPTWKRPLKLTSISQKHV
ncbi:hypothetical protein [Pseudomonas sp. TWI929]|uniref:hypothetical protein n=1 Tax=Pseudomonas sp. TWI929 TaxID=3136795 RepID=UPI0032099D04